MGNEKRRQKYRIIGANELHISLSSLGYRHLRIGSPPRIGAATVCDTISAVGTQKSQQDYSMPRIFCALAIDEHGLLVRDGRDATVPIMMLLSKLCEIPSKNILTAEYWQSTGCQDASTGILYWADTG